MVGVVTGLVVVVVVVVTKETGVYVLLTGVLAATIGSK